MSRPHDFIDLYLAPVALDIDAEIATLEGCTPNELLTYIVVATNREPRSADERREYFVEAVTHLHDLHGWRITCDPRGLRLAHGEHTLVLGLPATVLAYLGFLSDTTVASPLSGRVDAQVEAV
jgi:hypothetical protein